MAKLLRQGSASVFMLGEEVKASLSSQQQHAAPLAPAAGNVTSARVALLSRRASAAIVDTPADDPLRVLLLAAAFVAGVLAHETVRTCESRLAGTVGVFLGFFHPCNFRTVASIAGCFLTEHAPYHRSAPRQQRTSIERRQPRFTSPRR